jgi:hypothetical protein
MALRMHPSCDINKWMLLFFPVLLDATQCVAFVLVFNERSYALCFYVILPRWRYSSCDLLYMLSRLLLSCVVISIVVVLFRLRSCT